MVRRAIILLLAASWLAAASGATACRALCAMGICPEQQAAGCISTKQKDRPAMPDPGCAVHHHTVLQGVVPAGIPANLLSPARLSLAPAAPSAIWTRSSAIPSRSFLADSPPGRGSGRVLCLKISVLRV